MGEISQKIDVEKLISYCEDLVGVLKDKGDFKSLTNYVEHSKVIQSSTESAFNTAHSSIQDYEKKVNDCKHKIEAATSEVVADEEIDHLQKELDVEIEKEHLLRQQLRVIEAKIKELDHQRLSIEERSQNLKKLELEQEKEQRKLSFYASVTNIIPDMENQSKICGNIVRRDKNSVQKFEFDPADADSFDICNDIWKMINR